MKNSKVIFLLGPAGSGKTTVSRELPSTFKISNVDNEYIQLLQKSGIGLKIADFGHDELSIAAKCLATAHANQRVEIEKLIQSKTDFIYDGTGGSYKVIEGMVNKTIAQGYDIFCIMCWASPYTTLKRNYERERTIKPSIIIRNWRDVFKNYTKYRYLFLPNFYTVNTEKDTTWTLPEYWKIDEALKEFPVKGSGKNYTEQEKKDKQNEFNQIKSEIAKINIEFPFIFDRVDDTKEALKYWLNK